MNSSSCVFDPPELNLLESVGRLVEYAAGTFLWHEDDRAQNLFVVAGGRVRIIQSRNGRQYLLHTAGPGETIGEVPLIDGLGYPASAVAAGPTRCLVVERRTLLDAMRRHPVLCERLLLNVSRRVRHLIGRLEHQTLGTVRSRLAASLLGASAATNTLTVEMGTQGAWAEDIGTVRESLAREISIMRKNGILERVGRHKYAILDEKQLEQYLID